MKVLLTLLAVFTLSNVFSQLDQIKFKESTFENGMLYPVAVLSNFKIAEDKINKHLLSQIDDLKNADFCIGNYGYVQKGAHLQIHIFCNCIDFDESQNRYYLYNTETGDNVQYSDLLNPQRKKDAVAILQTKVKTFSSINPIELSTEDLKLIEDKNLDAFKIVFKREGMDLWLKSANWGEKPLYLTWPQMRSVLKYSYL